MDSVGVRLLGHDRDASCPSPRHISELHPTATCLQVHARRRFGIHSPTGIPWRPVRSRKTLLEKRCELGWGGDRRHIRICRAARLVCRPDPIAIGAT